MMVEDLETKTTGDYLLAQILGDPELPSEPRSIILDTNQLNADASRQCKEDRRVKVTRVRIGNTDAEIVEWPPRI